MHTYNIMYGSISILGYFLKWYIVKVMYNSLTVIWIVSNAYDCTERHSRTTIYTTKTLVVKKRFIEEQLVNDQWVTTDEYQVSTISYNAVNRGLGIH